MNGCNQATHVLIMPKCLSCVVALELLHACAQSVYSANEQRHEPVVRKRPVCIRFAVHLPSAFADNVVNCEPFQSVCALVCNQAEPAFLQVLAVVSLRLYLGQGRQALLARRFRQI